MIDLLGADDQFFVLTDCGGCFGWTTFDSWEPTNEPDVPLDPEYVVPRTQARRDVLIDIQESTECRPITEPGSRWHRIGRIDSTGRRSLWIRETYGPDSSVIELRAGREGDDAYVRLTPENPQWGQLSQVLGCARFAAEYEDPDGMTLERENVAHADANWAAAMRDLFPRPGARIKQWVVELHREITWEHAACPRVFVAQHDDNTGARCRNVDATPWTYLNHDCCNTCSDLHEAAAVWPDVEAWRALRSERPPLTCDDRDALSDEVLPDFEAHPRIVVVRRAMLAITKRARSDGTT
jgi:hypothetical protein